ncbi:DUF2513 domain-containing protein [Bradyrhizobium sp. LA2.1]|uniref:DUF2513 domain-containing protein n=1 Tax=Bradyrhizobium sp. LA2.1 TaxID=3156376 RepID=UPI003396D3F8
MKRDMDYVRELLLKIEASPDPIEDTDELESPDASREAKRKLWYHLAMLIDEVGLIKGQEIPYMSNDVDDDEVGRMWEGAVLTWRGHEFLEAVRDKDVWAKTVAGAKKAGNFGFDLLLDLAKAYGKQYLKERLPGLEL